MKKIGDLKLFIRVINYKLIEDGTLSNILNIDKESIHKIVDYDLFVVSNEKNSKYQLEDLILPDEYIKMEEKIKPFALTGLDAMKFLFNRREKNIDDFCIESIPIFSKEDILKTNYKNESLNINGIFELYRFIDDTNEAFVKLIDTDDYPEVLRRYKDLQEVVTDFYKYLGELKWN